MKTLGIIGGLGPMATTYFLYLITNMSLANTDQEHMNILLYSKPTIPDRTGYIIGKSTENPAPQMIEVGRQLKAMGAETLAIPCITAHYFHNELEREIQIKIVHAIRETAMYLKNRGIKKIGVLATDGTVQSRIFTQVFDAYQIETIYPKEQYQRIIMDLIYNQIKAGEKGNLEDLMEVGNHMFLQGAEVNLLGCTELSILKRDHILPPGYLDVLEVLSRSVVLECGRFNPKFDELIS